MPERLRIPAEQTALSSPEAARFAANVLPLIGTIQAAGVTSLRGIAAALNARGIPTARGGRWQVSNVRNLLRRQERG